MMGWLAPDLYAEYRNFGNHCGDSRPAWDDLDASERYRWEAVMMHVGTEMTRACCEIANDIAEKQSAQPFWQKFKRMCQEPT